MKYYDAEFHYYPCPTVNCPGDDDRSREASEANFAADDLVEKAAQQHNIEMVHAYSWPDGSLYKYLRSHLELEKLKQLFTIDAELTRPAEDGDESEKMKMSVTPSIREMPLEKAQCIQGGSAFFITLEERFELAKKHHGDSDDERKAHRDAMMAIHAARETELKAIPDYTAYDKAREACPICKPGKMACENCGKLCDLSWKTRTAFLEQHRPITSLDKQ